MNALLTRFDRLDAALVRAGFPATSPWWRAQLERLVTSDRRRWVIRAGRRAGKSSTMCRLAVAVALGDEWRASIPPGDLATIAFASVDREEASRRLHTIREILRTLGVPFDERGDEIALADRPCVLRVVTSSVRGVVGFTSVLVIGDEMSRWESRDTAANPAREIMASLRPTMATVPSALEVCVSSPWSTDDYHAELCDGGDTEHQIYSFAPTWEANPTLTEARTRELEPDPRAWSREYAAIPGVALSNALDPDALIRAFDRGEVPDAIEPGVFIAIDASSLRKDTFAWCVAGATEAGALVVLHVGGAPGGQGLTTDDALDMLIEDTAPWIKRFGGMRGVFADQYAAEFIGPRLAERGMRLEASAWTVQSKEAAVTRLRELLRDDSISIVPEPRLKNELLNMQARLTPGGRETFATNGKDYLACVLCLCDAAHRGDLPILTDSHAAAMHRAFAPENIAHTSRSLAMLAMAHSSAPIGGYFARLEREEALASLRDAGLNYPLVTEPDPELAEESRSTLAGFSKLAARAHEIAARTFDAMRGRVRRDEQALARAANTIADRAKKRPVGVCYGFGLFR